MVLVPATDLDDDHHNHSNNGSDTHGMETAGIAELAAPVITLNSGSSDSGTPPTSISACSRPAWSFLAWSYQIWSAKPLGKQPLAGGSLLFGMAIAAFNYNLTRQQRPSPVARSHRVEVVSPVRSWPCSPPKMAATKPSFAPLFLSPTANISSFFSSVRLAQIAYRACFEVIDPYLDDEKSQILFWES